MGSDSARASVGIIRLPARCTCVHLFFLNQLILCTAIGNVNCLIYDEVPGSNPAIYQIFIDGSKFLWKFIYG